MMFRSVQNSCDIDAGRGKGEGRFAHFKGGIYAPHSARSSGIIRKKNPLSAASFLQICTVYLDAKGIVAYDIEVVILP